MDSAANDELAMLKAELAATQQRLQELEAVVEQPRASRRNFLKLAAAGVAGGTAAALASSESAAAATGGALLIGNSNSPTAFVDTTVLESPSASNLAPNLLSVRNYSGSTNSVDSVWRLAIYGTASDADAGAGHRIGIVGEARNFTDSNTKGIGVVGAANRLTALTLPAEPVGVLGTADAQGVSGAGTGVKGAVFNGSSTIGVHGVTDNTVGVQAEATGTGGVGLNAVAPTTGIAARVSGRFRQVTAGSAGAPSFSVGNAGEQWRDSNGAMWICTVTGAPGTWRKVVAQHPNFPSAGGSLNLLVKPIRVLDTRGNGAPQTNGGAQLAANTDLVVGVVGVDVGGISVPAGAVGVFGNLTSVAASGNGFMTLWAADVAQPGTSNLNFRTGVNVANSFTCAVSAAGEVTIRTSQASHILLDITGFLF